MKVIYIILFSIIFTPNSLSQNFSAKKGGNCFNMEIPNYMTETYNLNDAASLQYNNTLKEAYVIAIEDSKDELKSLGMIFINSKDFLENFTKDYQIDSKNRTISEITEFESNENQHAQVEMTWNNEDGDFYMLITAVETNGHFYKILCWTLLEYKDNLKDDYLTISKSLLD
jgi:hypothetical protein